MGEWVDCGQTYDTRLFENNDIGVLTSIIGAAIGYQSADRTAELMIEEFGDLANILAASVKELRSSITTPPEVIEELERIKYVNQAILRRNICNRSLLEDLKSVKEYFRSKLLDKRKEQFHALYLDSGFKLVREECIQIGTVDHVSVYPREIIASAIECSATRLILVHNHPSGGPAPSVADILMTNDLIDACSYFGIQIADHIIIGRDGEFSFRENSLLETR